eukprot:Hpha_TRINITY_DN29942_c0_g1::TRINITY_DN29942_c0_g1_i1::g.131999::m.131999
MSRKAVFVGLLLSGPKVVHAQCSAADCSNHSQGVIWDGFRCRCTCSNGWGPGYQAASGSAPEVFGDCSSCSPPYALGVNASCDACDTVSTPNAGFPTCDVCTVGGNCTGHAFSVRSDGYQCLCACINRWSGGECDYCPSPYSVVTDCGCRNQWTGSNCAVCPFPYGPNVGGDCDGCNETRGEVGCTSAVSRAVTGCVPSVLPNCTACDATLDCSGHQQVGVPVGSDGYRCLCSCQNQWSSLDCSLCPGPYAGSDCDACQVNMTGCAAGECGQFRNVSCAAEPCPRLAAPVCRLCDMDADCSGHAHWVKGDGRQCTCKCRNQWTGPDCSVCPQPYGGTDCDGCMSPLVGCTPPSSLTSCAPSPAPVCSNVCTLEYCGYNRPLNSYNAFDVASDGYRCICSCKNQWTGNDCSVCPEPFGGLDCNGCIPGYVGCSDSSCPPLSDPQCRRCTSASDCSGHAAIRIGAATNENQHWIGSDGYNCNCTCADGWTGTDVTGRLDCSLCRTPFAGDMCDRCEIGYKYIQIPTNASVPPVRPNCIWCDSNLDCSGNDVPGSVTSDGLTCCCTCRNAWDSSDCSQCDTLLYVDTGDCDRCTNSSEGRFPLCDVPGSVTIEGQLPTCADGQVAANLTVDCSDRARAAAQFYYARRNLKVLNGPEALWYHTEIGLPDQVTGLPAPGCLRKLEPDQLDVSLPLRNPGDLSHVQVCQVTGSGLVAEYFTGMGTACGMPALDSGSLQARVVRKEPGVYNGRYTFDPWPGLTFADSFAARWAGYLRVNRSGVHSFTLGSDDGAQLWVDGVLVVDNDKPGSPVNQWEGWSAAAVAVAAQQSSCHNFTQKTGNVALGVGLHHISVVYFEQTGRSIVDLRMKGPGTCGDTRPIHFRSLLPINTFVLSYATSTVTPTTTPTQTALDFCQAFPDSTFCTEFYQKRYSLMMWALAIVPFIVCCVMLYFPARARVLQNSTDWTAPPAVPPERGVKYFDPPAIPDGDGILNRAPSAPQVVAVPAAAGTPSVYRVATFSAPDPHGDGTLTVSVRRPASDTPLGFERRGNGAPVAMQHF